MTCKTGNSHRTAGIREVPVEIQAAEVHLLSHARVRTGEIMPERVSEAGSVNPDVVAGERNRTGVSTGDGDDQNVIMEPGVAGNVDRQLRQLIGRNRNVNIGVYAVEIERRSVDRRAHRCQSIGLRLQSVERFVHIHVIRVLNTAVRIPGFGLEHFLLIVNGAVQVSSVIPVTNATVFPCVDVGREKCCITERVVARVNATDSNRAEDVASRFEILSHEK